MNKDKRQKSKGKKQKLLVSIFFTFYFITFNSFAQLTQIPLTLIDWNHQTCGTATTTANGIQINGANYRVGNTFVTNDFYDFTNSETYIKWKPSGPNGRYMAMGVGISGVASAAGCGTFFTVDHSFMNSQVLLQDTWYYTRIIINPNQTYTVYTCLNNYDNNGGTVVRTGTCPISTTNKYVKYGSIYMSFGDNYGGTNSNIEIGEVKTNARKWNLCSVPATFYNFEDNTVPSDFTTTGTWNTITPGYNSNYTLYTNSPANNTATLKVKDVFGFSFDYKSKSSSEYRLGNFNIDGVIGGAFDNTGSCWTHISYSLPPKGEHTISWSFPTSAYSTTNVELWLDNVNFYILSQPYIDSIYPKIADKCVGDSVTFFLSAISATAYQWKKDGVIIPNATDTFYSIPKIALSDTGTYWCIVSNPCGKDSVSARLTSKNSPVVNLGNDTSLCSKDLFTIDAGNAGSTYLWQDGSTNKTYTTTTAGTFSVVIDNGTCVNSDSIKVTIAPTYNITTTANICSSDSIFLQDNYQTISGIYYDSLLTTTNCDSIITTQLTVFYPSIFLGNDTTLCDGKKKVLNAGSFASYQWQDSSVNSTFTAEKEGIYYVQVTDSNGCTANDTIEISFCPYTTTLWIPNAFTPNSDGINDKFPKGDGINDDFYAVGENITCYHLLIFNRWGELLFETEESSATWDGTYKGKLVSDGVYIWTINYCGYENGKETEKELIGHVTVLK